MKETEQVVQCQQRCVKTIFNNEKHDFVDIYDTEDSLPEQIQKDMVNILKQNNYPECDAETISALTMVKRTYVKSYCKKCGLEIKRTT